MLKQYLSQQQFVEIWDVSKPEQEAESHGAGYRIIGIWEQSLKYVELMHRRVYILFLFNVLTWMEYCDNVASKYWVGF